ncbi:MAG: hypothetical protein AVDCRST_MAG39-883, partial [uncultured Sphingomonadaceae bacterium]
EAARGARRASIPRRGPGGGGRFRSVRDARPRRLRSRLRPRRHARAVPKRCASRARPGRRLCPRLRPRRRPRRDAPRRGRRRPGNRPPAPRRPADLAAPAPPHPAAEPPPHARGCRPARCGARPHHRRPLDPPPGRRLAPAFPLARDGPDQRRVRVRPHLRGAGGRPLPQRCGRRGPDRHPRPRPRRRRGHAGRVRLLRRRRAGDRRPRPPPIERLPPFIPNGGRARRNRTPRPTARLVGRDRPRHGPAPSLVRGLERRADRPGSGARRRASADAQRPHPRPAANAHEI